MYCGPCDPGCYNTLLPASTQLPALPALPCPACALKPAQEVGVDPNNERGTTRIYMTRMAQPWHVDAVDLVGGLGEGGKVGVVRAGL